MAKRNIPNLGELILNLDRRSFLGTGLATTVAGIVPNTKVTESALVIGPGPPAASEALPNVSATMARRLAEIARRNELRREAKLPTLRVVKELRLMKRAEDEEEFNRFAAPHRQAVLAQVIQQRRAAEGNPNWRPNFMEAMAIQNDVNGILRQRFRKERRKHRAIRNSGLLRFSGPSATASCRFASHCNMTTTFRSMVIPEPP